MAYQFTTGFDYYTTASQLWDTVSGTITISSASARFTGTHSQGASFPQNAHAIKNLSTNFVTLILGCAVKFTALPNAADLFMGVEDAATFQTGLTVSATGALQFCRGTAATLIGSASSAGLIVAGVWNYIEMQVTINNTTGTGQCWVNGVSVINSSGLNNRNSANAFANQVAIGEFNNNGTAVPILFDDLYCLDTSGSTLNSVLGDRRIITIMPSGVGSFSNFTPVGSTPNWTCVDEIPADDDTTYVADGTTGDRDSYTYESVTLQGNPDAVIPWGRVRKDDAGSRSIELTLRNSGNDAFSSALSVPSSYQYLNGGAFTLNPNGNIAWDQNGINSTEFGIKIVAPGEIPLTFRDTMTESDALAKTLA